jgi:hypothetical protein
MADTTIEIELERTELERQQRILGILSSIFAGMETLFFLLTVAIPIDAEPTVFLIMSMGLFLLAGLGSLTGIFGLTRAVSRFRVICLSGTAASIIVLGIGLLVTVTRGYAS